MSLKHILLGFINYGPMTGYDLKKHLDNSTQYFWHAKLSQIYPLLKQMEEDSWTESSISLQEGKPDKKYYVITDKGREALHAWLKEKPQEIAPHKEAELLKIFFASALDKEEIIAQLEILKQLRQARLQEYETKTADYIRGVVEETGLVREGEMWELTRKFGENYERMYVAWLEQAIQTTKNKLE